MPLTLAELEEIQADAMADDIDIDLATMSLWTREKAIKFFEGGGVEEKTFTPLPKLSKPKAVDKAAWLKTQSKNTKGDTYGIEFPHTFGQLSTYGASWFTKAFRLAGTLSEDNAVEELVDISRCLGGGAAEKAPKGAELCKALFAQAPIEWTRLGAFQDVTIRLIAERLLPGDAAGTTYVDQELTQQMKPLAHPRTSPPSF